MIKERIVAAISITLPDEQMLKIQEMAERAGVSVEDLVRCSIDDLLAQPDAEFARAVESVVQKNAELYRRLA